MGPNRITDFGFNEAALTPRGRNAVEELARWLTENPTVTIWIKGHTDQQGTDEYNQLLGEKRAQQVLMELVASGISKDRLLAESAGEKQLICLERTVVCHTLNRRVEWGIMP